VLRAPLVFYPGCVGLALLWAARREALEWRRAGALAAGCAIPALGLLAYNLYVFGTWNGSTQLQPIAAAFGGDPWSTPLWSGALGVLVSPSRGLFVYSPVLVFSIYGAIRALTHPAWAALRPFAAAAAALSILYAKWSAWWGGWCFGPRLLIDVLPVACLLLLPALEGLRASRLGRAAFALTLVAALFNSALGTLAYDLVGWDARDGFAVVDPRTGAADLYIDRDKATAAAAARQHTLSVVHMDVDAPSFRYRLWRVRDSPLAYYVAHFDAARRQRLRLMQRARALAQWAPPPLVAK
jgi:hypothetical protein